MLGGRRSQLCLCCRPTHSPSGSPIRTTSSIKCGAGTVGYSTDWPGEWHSPVILKLTIAGGGGGQALLAHGWFLEPTPSPKYRTASLFPFLRTCIAAGAPASSSVSSHSLNHLSSWVLAARSKPFKKIKPCFHSGRREWQSPRMGRLALSPEEHASALSAQRRQRKLCPNFFLHNLYTRTLATC